MRIIVSSSLPFIFFVFALWTARAQGLTMEPADGPKMDGSYLIMVKDSVADVHAKASETLTSLANYGMGGNPPELKFVYDQVVRGFNIDNLLPTCIEMLEKDEDIIYVGEDGMAEGSNGAPSLPWGLDRIDQSDLALDMKYMCASDGAHDGKGVTIYIVDTGLDSDHPEIQEKIIASKSKSFVPGTTSWEDDHGHGTHVGGTAAGTTVGVAPWAMLVAVKVLASNNRGQWSWIINGVNHVKAVAEGRSIANISIGGGKNTMVNTAVKNLRASGVIVTVSAGNDKVDASTKSPASEPTILTVGGTKIDDTRYDTGTHGSNYGSVLDILAPGQGILSAQMGGGYVSFSGTSMAAPHVAGVCALLWDQWSGEDADFVEGKLLAQTVSDKITGFPEGTVNKLLQCHQVIPNGRTAEAKLDPHFMTWAGQWYDYMGACDLILTQAPYFDMLSNMPLTINIRTKIRYSYSYIRSAVVQIGSDKLEVASYGDYFLNGVSTADLPATMSGYNVTHTQPSKKVHLFEIMVDVIKQEKIIIKTFKDMVSVVIENANNDRFHGSLGMMGDYGSGSLLARDGATVVEDPNAFAAEWQVRADEPMLFQSREGPQHPQACDLPDPTTTTKETSRRLLGEAIPREVVENACAKWAKWAKDAAEVKACIHDVIATGDLELAEAGAF